jgi:succinate-semialdehyde dehydrogenase/glutarate-semialdehyde dehydrogenase
MIVHSSIEKEFIKLLKLSFESKNTGNPLSPDIYIGPLARKDLRDNLHRQVTQSIELGAEVILGCQIPECKGYFYPPSILRNVSRNMPAYNEELFGPGASISTFNTEEEAINIANDHVYGLGGAVFTKDIEKGEYIARELINSGSVQVNDFVRSDPRLPFGGTKQSGFGRELSAFGIREFVNIKTVCVR